MAFGLKNAKPGKDKTPRIDEIVKVHKFAPKQFEQFRIMPASVSPGLVMAQHWIKLRKKTGEEVSIPKLCLAFDSKRDEFDGECPYCDLPKEDSGYARRVYYFNAIVRDEQDKQPKNVSQPTKKEKASGLMAGNYSRTWTPVRVIRLPASVVQKILDLSALNVHDINGEREEVDASDPDFGMDFNLKFDNSIEGTDKYQIQKVESTPLDDDELEYMCWDLENPDLCIVDSRAEAENLVKRAYPEYGISSKESNLNLGEEDDSDLKLGDTSDDDQPETSGLKKPRNSGRQDRPGSGRGKPPPEDDDLDLDLDDDDDIPAKKPASGRNSEDKKVVRRTTVKRKPPPEDDDLDLDDDRPAKKPASGRNSSETTSRRKRATRR